MAELPAFKEMAWTEAIDIMSPFMFRIETPGGSGTGWLLFQSKDATMCAVATADHVVQTAQYWEQPIKLIHEKTGWSKLLRHTDRAILSSDNSDSAGILFKKDKDVELPFNNFEMIEKEKFTRPGVEVGWLGYPSVSRSLCFFSGRISAYIEDVDEYLVDGVAINGVSGGPVFYPLLQKICLTGLVRAYRPNIGTNKVLPGVSVICPVDHIRELSEKFTSVDEAKKTETPPSKPPEQPPATSGSSTIS